MKPLPFARTALALGLAALAGTPASASTPVSGEFRANTYLLSNQVESTVAMDADGDFVATWSSYYQDGAGYGIYAQRYSAAGSPRGSEFRVNTTTASYQRSPSVALDADGDFTVVWQSYGQDGTDYGIYAQRYNAGGVAQGGEFRVNTTTAGHQRLPRVAMDADGDFVVAWDSAGQDGSGYGIYAQRYNAAGVAQGDEFRVNSFTTGNQQRVAMAMDADGDFIVTWDSDSQDGSSNGVYAQRYDAAGAPQGGEFRVNATTFDSQNSPGVGMDADGDFVVAWMSSSQDGSGYGVYAQRYNAAGVAQGGEFRGNSYTIGTQSHPSVALDADGDFVVAWESYGQDGSYYGIYAQRYTAAGAAQGGEFRLNLHTASNQRTPRIALDADGDFIAVWQSTDQDGSGTGVYGRRYRGPDPVDLVLSQFDTPDPVVTGAPLSYTLRISNLQPPADGSVTGIAAIDSALAAASAVRIVSTPPAGASFVSASGTGWSCGPLTSTTTCRLASTLRAGQNSDLVLSYSAPAAGGTIQHTGQALLAQYDPNLANNLDTETTQVACTVQLSATSYSAGEASANLTVTATRSSSNCPASSVQYDTAGGSAAPGLDFTDVTGTLSWANGESGDKSFTVPLLADSLDEISEKFTVILSSPLGAQLGSPSKASGIISDDDALPRINFTAAQQTAAEPGALASLTVQLSEISGRNVTVNLARAGTATADSDYFSATKLTIPPGQRSVSFDIEVADDATQEGTEFASFTLSGPVGATLGSLKTHTLYIGDDEPAPVIPTVSFTAATNSGTEAQSRSAVIQLSQATTVTVTVPFSVSGTAIKDVDYTLNRSGTVTFAPGITQLGIASTPVDDAVDEPDETLVLSLGAPVNATLGATTVHTRTIVDND